MTYNQQKKQSKRGCVMISRLLHNFEKMIFAFYRIKETKTKIAKLKTLSITKQGEWWAKRVGCNTLKHWKCNGMYLLLMGGCNATSTLLWKPLKWIHLKRKLANIVEPHGGKIQVYFLHFHIVSEKDKQGWKKH